jgi:hypothetical protein
MQNLATDVENSLSPVKNNVDGLKLGTRGCRYTQTTAVTLATGGAKVPFQTATKPGSLITASGTGNTDFAVGATGWIMAGANIRYGSGITAPYLAIRLGATELSGNNHTTAADGFVNTGTTTGWYATAGDSFNVFVNLGQSVPMDINGLTNFWLVYLGL